MKNLKFLKKYILSMTFFDWFSLIVDLSIIASLICFTFYLGVEVGRVVGS